ncbi:MAG TPA: exodeoxyribonuclease VII large subunit [Chthoniobacterales bacterium]|nr:exodeoxyribonuclease VII large subunit [Chthoniobacterales bacterium]
MQLTAGFFQTSKILTVGELTRAIRSTLETKFGAVWVQGEISNYKLHPSGHQYFTLRDARAQIACVIFRNTMAPLRQPLVDGAQVQVYGNVSVFEARGQYQLSVQILQPRGLGLLQAKFEALKRKLEAEGLFDPARKRVPPKFPRRIGIVTSASGAAIRDLLNVLQRRAPWLQILINPVRVQGTGAAEEIAVAIRELATPNENWLPLDLIVVARGGGSIEDLWAFNEEIVARTIVDAGVPIVSAIGHEIDFTICDFVADLRAPTPSAAAELVVPDIIDLRRRIDVLAGSLDKCLRNFLAHQQTRLRFLSERTLARELLKRMRDAQQEFDLARESLHRHVAHKIDDYRRGFVHMASALHARSPARELTIKRNHFADLQRRFAALPPRFLADAKQRFGRMEGILRVLGPDATLRRGYSITRDKNGRIVRSIARVKRGIRLRTRVTDGDIESEVLAAYAQDQPVSR